MSRTNDMRKLIRQRLMSLQSRYNLKDVYYEIADERKMYPHIVYDLEEVNPTDKRRDYVLSIDLFGKDRATYDMENLADDIEDLFNSQNIPQDTILPTFYLETRRQVPDEDKTIKHIIVKFTVQNYEREG